MRHYGAYYKSKLGYEYILDTVPGASLALSLRKLRSAYTGYCIRIRRSSDNAELDIGFVNNVVDIATILTFIGAGSGYIVIWYDQSISNNSVSCSSALHQPLFVINSGITLNIKPSLFFNFSFLWKNTILYPQPNTLVSLVKDISVNNAYYSAIFDGISSRNMLYTFENKTNIGANYADIANYVKTTPWASFYNLSGIFKGVDSKLYENGVIKVSGVNIGSQGLQGFVVGSTNQLYYGCFKGYQAEHLFYNSEINIADLQKIDQNQKAYYGHY